MSVNSIHLLGRLGQSPELKDLPSGDKVCNFSIATSEKWKSKTGEDKEETQWHRITVFGKLAEVCGKYLVKGKQVFCQGKVKYRSYEKDGVTMYATDIVCDRIEFLGDKFDEKMVEQSQTMASQPQPQPAKKLPNYAPGAEGF